MDQQIIQTLMHLATSTDPTVVAEFLRKYALDKVQTSVTDLAMRPIVRLIQRRLHLRIASGEPRARLLDELEEEFRRTVDFAMNLEDRVAKLESGQGITDADLRRRLREPSVVHLIERGAEGATETADSSAAVILAELVTSRLRYDEDASAARSLQRAVSVASELTTTDLLLVGGIALVTVPDATDEYQQFVRDRDLQIYWTLFGRALPRLFAHPPVQIQVTDLESIGVLVQQPREIPGQAIQHRSPIELVVTGVLGEIPPDVMQPRGAFTRWMRPGSPLYRAARLAIPSVDGVTVSDRDPILFNYQLTTMGWRLAEAVLRGAVNLNISIADQLSL